MKIDTLVICGDAWHPAEIVRGGLGALMATSFDFKYLMDGRQWSPAMMKGFPLVIVAKANHISAMDQNPWLAAAAQSAFRDFVRDGGGLLLLHAGTCYKDLPEMCGVTGGAFLSHPDQCMVTVEPKVGHPLVRGVKSFAEKDEHYIMSLQAVDADVFLHSHSQYGVQPAGWTRVEGKGRVCALTPGHGPGVWLNTGFQRLLLNALSWAVKLDP